MIRTLLTCYIATFLFTGSLYAQDVYDGAPKDSLIISMSLTDKNTKDTSIFYIGNTHDDSLWQIGKTNKTFFANNYTGSGIMTDTINKYPDSANSSFYINTRKYYNSNFIITFSHKYQTDSGKAGGIIEFSTDTGKTWTNIMGGCTLYNYLDEEGIRYYHIYDTTTKLWTGEPAFTGTSNGWVLSRFQFFAGYPVKTTAPGPHCISPNPIIRFRFISDSTTNTTNDGWIIDNIKLEKDLYYGVEELNGSKDLNIHPNPAYNGIFSLPQLEGEQHYRIEVFNATGQQVVSQPYTHRLDMSVYSTGLYLYRVTDGDHLFTGRLVVQ